MNYKIKIHNEIEQKSPEWFQLRKAKLTASKAQAIGNGAKGLDTYVTELMADYHSSGEKDYFSTKDTDRGNELEPYALEIYELEYKCKVDVVGFVEAHDHVGCSPDGMISDDGLIEIKCLNDPKHYKIIRDGSKSIESAYLWQVQFQMLTTGRKYCDLAFYNPNFKKSLVVFRFNPESKYVIALQSGIEKGVEMIINQLTIK